MKDKIKKLTINIAFICENDNYYEPKNFIQMDNYCEPEVVFTKLKKKIMTNLNKLNL